MSIDEKSTKNRGKIDETSLSGAAGRFWGLRVVPGTRRDTPGTNFGRQVGPSWEPSWPSWTPCWPSWPPSWVLGAIKTTPGAVPEPSLRAFVSSSGARNDFSSFLDVLASSPGSSEVLFVLVFPILFGFRAKFASYAPKRRKSAKNRRFGPPKAPPGRSWSVLWSSLFDVDVFTAIWLKFYVFLIPWR